MTDKENFEKDINVPSKEQIMIDGVDVSGCLFYQSNFEEDYDVKIKHFCSNWHNSCESTNNSNCYYKQLARVNEELQLAEQLINGILKTLNLEAYDYRADQNEILTEIRAFKQECEQEDKEIKGLHLIIDRLLEASGYNKHISSAEDFEDVYKDMGYKLGLIDELKQECEALKSESFTRESLITLQEKDIDHYRKALEEIEEFCLTYSDNHDAYETVYKYILDVISKAKKEE